MNGGNRLPGQLGTYESYDGLTADDDWPVDAATGLVSLAFLMAAIRRSALFCCIMTAVGFLVGCGIYVRFPAPYKASTSVFLTYGPYENGQGASSDNQAIAQTRTVATLAAHKLGLQQDVGSVAGAYTASIVSNRMLLVTFTAPSASQALSGANAVASAFLLFRAGELQRAQEQVFASLNQQISQAKQRLSSIKAQIRQVSVQPSSSVQQSRLNGLRGQLTSATTTLANLQQAVNTNEATNQPATTAAIKGSQVLDGAALLPRSHLRHLLLYPGAGLIGGLVVGIAVVLIRATMSDRLRRRDDVADALGAPVKLSTGPLQSDRWWLVRRGQRADIRRIAAHLGYAVPGKVLGTAALAVVAVDDPKAAALPLASLAISCAQQGQRIVLADLVIGAPAARLLGERGVGVGSMQEDRLVVAVPERDDVAPIGPLAHAPARDQRSPFTDAVAAACTQADMLLTLVVLDPSVGGEHLPTWATDAVAIVTAGRSSWTKINAVGEMIRLSGTRLASAVLIGADKADESLGVVPAQHARDAETVEQGPVFNGSGPRLTHDEEQGKHRNATPPPAGTAQRREPNDRSRGRRLTRPFDER